VGHALPPENITRFEDVLFIACGSDEFQTSLKLFLVIRNQCTEFTRARAWKINPASSNAASQLVAGSGISPEARTFSNPAWVDNRPIWRSSINFRANKPSADHGGYPKRRTIAVHERTRPPVRPGCPYLRPHAPATVEYNRQLFAKNELKEIIPIPAGGNIFLELLTNRYFARHQ
jgi:hypothetical protein